MSASSGWFGGGPPAQPVVVADRPARSSGPGIGTAVLAGTSGFRSSYVFIPDNLLVGGAGLIGGALLENAFEDHDQDEREEGYQQGEQFLPFVSTILLI